MIRRDNERKTNGREREFWFWEDIIFQLLIINDQLSFVFIFLFLLLNNNNQRKMRQKRKFKKKSPNQTWCLYIN